MSVCISGKLVLQIGDEFPKICEPINEIKKLDKRSAKTGAF